MNQAEIRNTFQKYIAAKERERTAKLLLNEAIELRDNLCAVKLDKLNIQASPPPDKLNAVESMTELIIERDKRHSAAVVELVRLEKTVTILIDAAKGTDRDLLIKRYIEDLPLWEICQKYVYGYHYARERYRRIYRRLSMIPKIGDLKMTD